MQSGTLCTVIVGEEWDSVHNDSCCKVGLTVCTETVGEEWDSAHSDGTEWDYVHTAQ